MPAQAPLDDVPDPQGSSIYNHTSSAPPNHSHSPSPQMSDISNDLAALSINEGTRSPAQNLPPEIIIEIVLELVETQWDIAWTTAAVCRSWRFAALNITGRLWSRICVPVGAIPSSLVRCTLPNQRIDTWLQRGGPTAPLQLDLRSNSPLISNAFSDALNTTGAMNRVVEMRLSIVSREQWRMRTPAPNLRVLWLMGPVEKGASFVLLSAALQGLFGYPSFCRPSTSLKKLHLRCLKIDRSCRVFLQHITHLSLFKCTDAGSGASLGLVPGCSANLQVLSLRECEFPFDVILGGTQLPKLHSLSIGPNSFLWADTTASFGQLSAPSLQTLSVSASQLQSVSHTKYQSLKHLTVVLQIMRAGSLQHWIRKLDGWFKAPGLLTITLVLMHIMNSIGSTPALASPGSFFGQSVERVVVRLPPSAAATARMECENLKGVWAEVGKELMIEPLALSEY